MAMTPSIAAAQLANIVCTGKGASNNANRPSTTTSHGDSSKTLDNQIKAPPRAAIARDRSNDRDGFHQSEPQDNLPLLLENNDGADMTENNINPSEELKTTGSSKSPTESEADTAGRRGASSARWGSRTVGITSPRRARASLSPKETIHSMDPKSRGATEGRALGVAALAKLTGHGPAGKAGSKTSPTLQEDEPKKSPQQSVSSAENSQISVEEQQKLSAELEQLKDLAQIQEAELKALRAEQRKDRETSERQLREISHHEAKLASEIRDKTFWSKKHEEVHRQYLKTESEYRILQATVADRDGMWKREWERKNEHLLQERDRCRDGFHAAQRTSQERDEEARELRRQVLELKHSISTSTRTEAQVTDDVFREKVRVLGHDLQNWTITNFRKKDLDMSNLFDSVRDELSSIVPFYATLASKSRLNVIQSFVSGMLVQEVFRVYYFGLSPDRVSQLRNMEEYLLTVGSQASVNQWRSLTLALLRHSSDESLKGLTFELINQLESRIANLLSGITNTPPSDVRSKGLRSIMEQAVSLSRLFRVQRAQFVVDVPALSLHQPTVYDSNSMEDVSGDDDDRDGKQGEVRCVTFPAVCKAGDESGDNLHLRNIIVKAKVLCKPN